MKRLLACAIMLILAKACGVEEPYDTDFISRTQAESTLIEGNKHRHGGLHHNAYLINKVHNSDHPNPVRFGPKYLNLTVDVNVGWYGVDTKSCGSCSNRKGYMKAGKAPDPLPTGKNDGDECNCTYKTCTQKEEDDKTNLDGAVAHVNYAINEWLKPLAIPYGKTNDPIISGDYIHATNTDRKKLVPDLTINFLCTEASGDDNNSHGWNKNGLLCTHPNDTHKGSCFGYVNNNPPKDGEERIGQSPKPTDPDTSLTGNELARHNTPIIYIGNDPRDPSDIRNGYFHGYHKIGKHDQLDLMHNIGHAFGLWNTHKSQ